MSECKARVSATDPPQDCDWPWCGCDPDADRVIAAIQENDCAIVPISALRQVLGMAQSYAMQVPIRNPNLRLITEAAFAVCERALGEDAPPTAVAGS